MVNKNQLRKTLRRYNRSRSRLTKQIEKFNKRFYNASDDIGDISAPYSITRRTGQEDDLGDIEAPYSVDRPTGFEQNPYVMPIGDPMKGMERMDLEEDISDKQSKLDHANHMLQLARERSAAHINHMNMLCDQLGLPQATAYSDTFHKDEDKKNKRRRKK